MLCPVDLVQMHEFEKTGGGESTDEVYMTWEIKECPTCGRKALEFYSAVFLNEQMVDLIKTKGLVSKPLIKK